MFDWISNTTYWLFFSQAIITLVVVPMIIRNNFIDFARRYGMTQYPNAKNAIEDYLLSNIRIFKIVAAGLFLLSFAIVSHAAVNQAELFSWDNQAGLSCLFFIAIIPVLVMAAIQKRFFSLLADYSDGKRVATLKVRGVRDFISKPMILFIFSGQFLFIGSVFYFVNHPFDGFGGYLNLLGLAFLDSIFIITIYFTMNNKRLAMIKDPNQRFVGQQNAISVNVTIWIVALYYLCLTLWISGLDLLSYRIFMQSLYIHLMFLMVAFASKLPASFYQGLEEKR
ncbi:hypothetical protein [Brumicola pallidula]|jgi:hypothetical protein|uniref:Uncharacterized protein n=1 Tax=Brumicola pallidula DSM 14239 = ACAM 615 TaxID=1121922 RepID=K6YCS1_9ALTE|nr:hypothetical protein [Glaciecola pallidula]GAC30539.1 hypothetical protein GPAL_3698 [Glaciecola pallidula DSM 14239 = ACAM 615]